MEVSILSHLTNSALVVYGLQYLKGTKWYGALAKNLPMEEARVHRLASMLGALGAAVGMHGAVEGNGDVGWKIALAIPPLWVIFHGLWDWVQQIALNQLVFAIALQQKAAAPVITVPVPEAGPKVTVTAPVQDTLKG
jgi:hypothetical protein